MADINNFKCLLGVHTFEPYKEVEVKNIRGEVESITIISKCSNCGKLKNHTVQTLKTY